MWIFGIDAELRALDKLEELVAEISKRDVADCNLPLKVVDECNNIEKCAWNWNNCRCECEYEEYQDVFLEYD